MSDPKRLRDDYLAQVKVKIGEDEFCTTGYPIAETLLITAGHLFDEEDWHLNPTGEGYRSLEICFPRRPGFESFSSTKRKKVRAKEVLRGPASNLDFAIIEVDGMKFEAPALCYWPIAPHQAWYSDGFPAAAAGGYQGETRREGSNALVGLVVANPEEDFRRWDRASGSPLFLTKPDRGLAGIILEVQEGDPKRGGKQHLEKYCLSISRMLKLPEFRELVLPRRNLDDGMKELSERLASRTLATRALSEALGVADSSRTVAEALSMRLLREPIEAIRLFRTAVQQNSSRQKTTELISILQVLPPLIFELSGDSSSAAGQLATGGGGSVSLESGTRVGAEIASSAADEGDLEFEVRDEIVTGRSCLGAWHEGEDRGIDANQAVEDVRDFVSNNPFFGPRMTAPRDSALNDAIEDYAREQKRRPYIAYRSSQVADGFSAKVLEILEQLRVIELRGSEARDAESALERLIHLMHQKLEGM